MKKNETKKSRATVPLMFPPHGLPGIWGRAFVVDARQHRGETTDNRFSVTSLWEGVFISVQDLRLAR
jgi:hypothetical protein